MINIQDKLLCCGCEACVQACPKRCIAFKEDSEGFRYPSVDLSACIDCGLCETVCPIIRHPEPKEPSKVYATQNQNEEELLASSSGGMFILLAKETLHQGGVVFGAKYDKDWSVIHSFAETLEDTKAFMGSKYVQSRIGNSFIKAKEYLDTGRKVLFTGTPCQIAGLKSFLKKDYENLLTVDIICHGVPSPTIWKSYLQGKEINKVDFRDKRTGWKNYSITVNNKTIIYHRNHYMRCFLANLTLRPTCFQCNFKSGSSCSDLTLGDFWGISEIAPQLDNDLGTSVTLLNSSKGEKALNGIGMSFTEIDFDEICKYNTAIKCSVKKPGDYDLFWADFHATGKKAIIKWGSPKKMDIFKQFIYRLIH